MKSISEIAAELRESNPELGRPTARDLNNMLLVKGLICNVEKGKSPTRLGMQRGIHKRNGRDDMGRAFCYPVYDEEGERYVKTLALAYFAPEEEPLNIPDAALNTRTVFPTPGYHYTHRDHETAQNHYRDSLVLLEGPEAYWTYFQDARILSQIMGWNVYTNRRDIPGLAFQKDQLENVLCSLDREHLRWVVCSPQGDRCSNVGTETSSDVRIESDLDVVEIGSYIRVLINGETEMSFFLANPNTNPIIVSISQTGLVINTSISGFENDTITTDSAVGRALLGRRIGEVVRVPNNEGSMLSYQILGIK